MCLGAREGIIMRWRERKERDDDDIYSSRLPLGRTLAPLEQLILHPSLKPISSSFPTTTSWLTTSTTEPSSQYEHGVFTRRMPNASSMPPFASSTRQHARPGRQRNKTAITTNEASKKTHRRDRLSNFLLFPMAVREGGEKRAKADMQA